MGIVQEVYRYDKRVIEDLTQSIITRIKYIKKGQEEKTIVGVVSFLNYQYYY